MQLVKDGWEELDLSQRGVLESHAAALRDAYDGQLGGYEEIEVEKDYVRYLAGFRGSGSGNGKIERGGSMIWEFGWEIHSK